MQVSKAKPGYKLVDTGLGKFEEIPEEWMVSNLGDVCKQIQDSDHKMPKKIDDGIPFLSIKHVVSKNKIDFENTEFVSEEYYKSFLKKIKPEKNDILYSRVATIGEARLITVDKKFAFTYNVVLIKTSEKIESKFLVQLLNNESLKNYINSLAPTTAYSFLGLSDIKKIKIIVPTILEQQKIATILSNVDNTLEKTNQLIQKSELLKKGMMQKLLIRGIGHTKFKKIKWFFGKEIEIPEEWEIKKINELAEINFEQIKNDYEYEDIEYIDISSIKDFQIIKLNKYGLVERPSRAQRIVQKNDIIISTVRPNLKAFSFINLEQPNLICSTGFATIRTKIGTDAQFLFNYFKSHIFEENYIWQMGGIVYPAISSSVVSNSLIPTPRKDEQKQIATILSNVDSQINKEKLQKSNLEILKKGLMQKLLTGQIRVKV